MADVKRYNVNPDEHCLDEMYETETGHWVEYEDYASLRASHGVLLEAIERYLRTHHITEKAGDDFRAAIAKAERV